MISNKCTTKQIQSTRKLAPDLRCSAEEIKMKKLAILGEFNPASETHVATNAAIEHFKKLLEIDLKYSRLISAIQSKRKNALKK